MIPLKDAHGNDLALVILRHALRHVFIVDQRITSHMVVEVMAVLLVLLDIVERRQAPVFALRQKLEHDLLVVSHLDIVVVNSVGLVHCARQLDHPGRVREITSDVHIAIEVVLILVLTSIGNEIQSAPLFYWTSSACHLILKSIPNNSLIRNLF